MPGFTISLDPPEEGVGTEVAYADLGNLLAHSVTPAPVSAISADSHDTEGAIFALGDPKYGQAAIADKIRVPGDDAADLEDRLAALFQKLGKLHREGGVYKRTSPNGTVQYFDILPESQGGVAFDNRYISSFRAEVDVEYTVKPFWRRPESGNLTDDFSVDSIGAGDWAFDSGSGTLAVSGGLLVPSTTAQKRIYRTDLVCHDCEVTTKVTTGASVAAPFAFRVAFKILQAAMDDYLCVQLDSNSLDISKRDGGAIANLTTVAHVAGTATSYWVRGRIEGNKVTAEVFTAAPTPTSTPAATVSHTLTGADATKFGVGVDGMVGLEPIPGGTDERYDDFTVNERVYVETTNPALITPPIYGIGGDVPALGRLVVTDLANADQWQVDVGVQSRHLDTAATAGLYIAGTDLTPLGSSTDTGTAIRNTDLIPTWQAIASKSGLTHKGSFRLKIRCRRPTGNTGEVSVRLEWGTGDYRTPTLDEVTTYAADEREGVDTWVDCGVAHIPPEASSWEFRVLAKSTTTGDEIDVKDVLLIPTTEGYIELAGRERDEIPSTVSARDEFDQAAGALNAKTLPVGGTWATSGGATDFAVQAGED